MIDLLIELTRSGLLWVAVMALLFVVLHIVDMIIEAQNVPNEDEGYWYDEGIY